MINTKFLKKPWFIGISIGLLFLILGYVLYNKAINTMGDFSPGAVEGSYRAGDKIEGDKVTKIDAVKGDYVARDKIVHHNYEVKEKISTEKISSLSFSEIKEAIDRVPPFQKDVAGSYFKGIKVEWYGYLSSVRKKDANSVYLGLSSDRKIESIFDFIHCEVPIKDYPELSILPEGAKIRIQGEILEVSNLGVELINVVLFLPEKEKTSSTRE